MNGLSFNALPPIDLPLRFFLTAPVFVILCAVLILLTGESLWLSRWQPSMLALTHGFTLGFMTMVMMGALLQLLPVVGGVGIAKPRLIVAVCYSAMVMGTLGLMANFLWPSVLLTALTILLLASGLGVYIVALTLVLVKKLSQGDTIIGIRLSIAALFIVLLLGVLMLGQGLPITIDISFLPAALSGKALTNNHAILGLVGWGSLLIISVSFQVIPMFHVAPSFPKRISQFLPAALFVLLVLYAIQPKLLMTFIVTIHGIFAVSLLWVIAKRKRKIADTSIWYWQASAVTLLVINVFYFMPEQYLPDNLAQKKVVLIAALYLYWYLVAVIQGMLLKILPFLSFTHLQQRCVSNFLAMQYLPNMHDFLNKKQGQWLFYLHLLSGGTLLVTILLPSMYWLLAFVLFIEFTWLLRLMKTTTALYYATLAKINSLANE